MSRPTQRGFTLIEVLIAVLVGALGLAAAASVAQWATRQSGQGRQHTELLERLRLVSQQMRTDAHLAGVGSTGAVAADCAGNGLLTPLCVASRGGLNAIPVVRGVDNVGVASIGGVDILPGSDVIQLIVPDHSTAQQTAVLSRGNQIFVPGVNCPQRWLFVSDHSAPNGAGRTQLVMLTAPTAAAAPVTTADALQFTLQIGTDVMCARVSTYWVGADNILRRSDLTPGVLTVAVGAGAQQVFIPVIAGGADVVAPGVADLQIAYSFSSELAGRGTAPAGRWAFTATGPIVPAQPSDWFEARQVRFSFLMRSLRAVEDVTANIADLPEPALENRPAPLRIPVQYTRHTLSTSAVLVNLRYFDLNSPSGLTAEPF